MNTSPVTLTSPVPTPDGRRPDLTRTMLRLHRSALWVWGVTVVVAAVALLWAAGFGIDAALTELRAICGEKIDYCDSGSVIARYELVVLIGSWLLLFTPVLVAAWAGGSLIGRELENGTAALAWTQSVTPAHWLAAKLAVPAVVVTAGTTLLTVLSRVLWSAETELRDETWFRDTYDPTVYLTNGPVAVALPLLALALGALAGLALRRALPAIAVAAAAVVGAVVAMDWLRPHLWPVKTLIGRDEIPHWTGTAVEQGVVTATGEHVPKTDCYDGACAGGDVVGYYVDFHPASHFWPLQWVETGVLLALATLVTAACFALLRRRTGVAG